MDLSLRREGAVAILTWNDGENRLNLDSLGRLNEHLDDLEGDPDPFALVLTGTGKFFSNGLDLERFGHEPEEFTETLNLLLRTIGRLLLYPAYTVGALNGHAFAGGALLSCGLDYRVMREDRGYWCMNEAEIGLYLDDRLWSVLRHRLPKSTATTAALTARRFPGPDALSHGIVDELGSEESLLAQAITVATRHAGLNRVTLAHHKRLIHGDEASLLGWNG